MFIIKQTSEIATPVEKVWQAITATKYYPQWNSQLAFLGGNLALNEKIHLKLTPQGGNGYEFKPIIIKFTPQKEFAWLAETGFKGIFDGEHHFLLEKLNDRQTLLINYEKYSGLIAPLMKKLPMMKNAHQGFILMNEEIKNRAESI